jgi:steroid delta-isomerase-like uncharacterized protein
MSIEENKAIIRRWVEQVMNQGNLNTADQLLAPNWVNLVPASPTPATYEDFKSVLNQLHTAFPDLQFTIEELIAEGDKVVHRWTMRGTHQGELTGLPVISAGGSIPPTGKPVVLTGITIQRIIEGKIVEDRFAFSSPNIEQQLGITPPPGQAST